MPTSPDERRKLQNLYPEPQKRYGMNARTPTKFHVPVFQLSLLLFLPIFFTVAIYSVQLYGTSGNWNDYAISFIGIFCFVIVSIIASILMLLYARTIVIRNCRRSWIVEGIYLLVVVPFGFLLLLHALDWFGQMLLWQLFVIEAALLYSVSLVTALIARRLSR